MQLDDDDDDIFLGAICIKHTPTDFIPLAPIRVFHSTWLLQITDSTRRNHERGKSLENDTLYPMRLKLDEIPFQSEQNILK